jgi:hypothetical protein
LFHHLFEKGSLFSKDDYLVAGPIMTPLLLLNFRARKLNPKIKNVNSFFGARNNFHTSTSFSAGIANPLHRTTKVIPLSLHCMVQVRSVILPMLSFIHSSTFSIVPIHVTPPAGIFTWGEEAMLEIEELDWDPDKNAAILDPAAEEIEPPNNRPNLNPMDPLRESWGDDEELFLAEEEEELVLDSDAAISSWILVVDLDRGMMCFESMGVILIEIWSGKSFEWGRLHSNPTGTLSPVWLAGTVIPGMEKDIGPYDILIFIFTAIVMNQIVCHKIKNTYFG